MTQVIKEPISAGALPDLILTNKEELAGGVKVRSSLSCSDHEMVETRILGGWSKAKSGSTTLDVSEQTLVSSGIRP